MYAASHNNSTIVAELITAGANIEARNITGNTPLLLAAKNNSDAKVIATLLNFGANSSVANNLGETAWDLFQNNSAISHSDDKPGVEIQLNFIAKSLEEGSYHYLP